MELSHAYIKKSFGTIIKNHSPLEYDYYVLMEWAILFYLRQLYTSFVSLTLARKRLIDRIYDGI